MHNFLTNFNGSHEMFERLFNPVDNMFTFRNEQFVL